MRTNGRPLERNACSIILLMLMTMLGTRLLSDLSTHRQFLVLTVTSCISLMGGVAEFVGFSRSSRLNKWVQIIDNRGMTGTDLLWWLPCALNVVAAMQGCGVCACACLRVCVRMRACMCVHVCACVYVWCKYGVDACVSVAVCMERGYNLVMV